MFYYVKSFQCFFNNNNIFFPMLCLGENKRIEPFPFFHGCRNRRLEEFNTFGMACNLMAMRLPSVTSAF
jgi:hypothetical protein